VASSRVVSLSVVASSKRSRSYPYITKLFAGGEEESGGHVL
jgi:hypothetical protein